MHERIFEPSDTFERVDDKLMFIAELRLIGKVLPPASAAHAEMFAFGEHSKWRGCEDFDGPCLREILLHTPDPRADFVARHRPLDEEDHAIDPRDGLPVA